MDTEVCYVVNSVSETSVPATIATALVDEEDMSVDILAWFDAESFEGDDRVGVHCLDAPDSTTGLDRETYRGARKQLQKYDLIQAHHNHSGSFAKIIGHRLGIPLVSREGNVRSGFTREGRIANGLTNGLADRIVPNSRTVYESFRRWERLLLDEDNVEIIHNGVDVDRIDIAVEGESDLRERFGIAESAIVVGTAAVITQQKALDVFVEGVHNADGQSDREIHAIIAGDGPHRSRIEALVAEFGAEDRIHFTGAVERNTVYRLLGEIDIYAMPSRWEGFSMAAVEALGAGKPCLFSDIDPFLRPYRNVAVFHNVDDPGDFAGQLVELAENPELRDCYGRKGRELVEQEYTLSEVAGQYAAVYEELV